MPELPSAPLQSTTDLVKRLLLLSWTYRRGCLAVLRYQVVLLAMGVFGLGLTGLAIDVIRHAVSPATRAPQWPFGLAPPASFSDLAVVAFIGAAVLVMAT